MRITKKLIAEIKEVMNTYWDSYMLGDLKKWASYLPKDYKNIGTTQEEIWNSKEEIVDYTLAVAEQMIGMAEFRNKETQIIPYDPYIMVHELGDLFVKIDGAWSFYAKFRLSSLLKKTASGWKVYHQHGSYPDSKTQEGEAFAFDTLKAENRKLVEAVKDRTAELESKNRELEVEASLEKVRSQTMAMQKSEELQKVIQVVYDQFVQLGFPIGHTGFILDYKNRKDMYIWLADQNQIHSQITLPYFDSPHWNSFLKAKKTNANFFANYLGFEAKNKFYKQIFSHIDGIPKKTQQYYFKIPGLAISTVLLDNVGLYVENFEGVRYTEEENAILLRFGKVFQQAYTRFLDLQKAETQAREAQIEASLERVRAVAMGMHKPDNLMDICKVVYAELRALGFSELRNTLIDIFEDEEKYFIDYDYSEFTGGTSSRIPYSGNPVVEKYITDIRRSKKGFSEITVKGKQLETWKNFRRANGEIEDSRLNNLKALYYYKYSIGPGGIGISTYSRISNEKLNILHRFRNVFQLSYQRYADIAKAEAQAREAQIEAALERIRARALAMHKSHEFIEVAKVMREQMGLLGQPELETSAVHLYDEDADFIFSWRAFRLSSDNVGNITPGFFKIPKTSCAIAKAFVKKFKSKASTYTIDVSGAEQTEWYKILFKLAPEVQEAMKRSGTTKAKRYYHFSKFTGGALLMVTSKEPATDTMELQKRSALVFDLAYRRFKDLQSAEAQAREAQIEVALERVRSRSLAMHHTSELQGVIHTVHKELTDLNIAIAGGSFITINSDLGKGFICWGSGGTADYTEEVKIPHFNNPLFTKILIKIKKGPGFFTEEYTQEEKKDFFKQLFRHEPWSTLEAKNKKEVLSTPGGYTRSCCVSKHTSIFIINHFGIKFTEDDNDILKRFGKVFEQAYTRFLDLQKAEAQAREAQIQLALERVRARTMAMQNSNELAEVSYLLNKQVVELGIPTRGCAFNIYNEHDSTEWFSNLEGTMPTYKTPREKVFLNYYEAGQRGETLFIEEYSGKKIKEHYKYLFKAGLFGKDVTEETIKAITPEIQIDHVAYFKYGYLLFITLVPAPEAHEVFKRFAKEFEQTYTRFLDLQKAEAQAREAQIEAALERIRSRSLAMYKTDDLADVVKVLFDQMQALSVDMGFASVSIFIFDEGSRNVKQWIPVQDGVASLKVPYFDHPILSDLFDAKDSGDDYFAKVYTLEEKNTWLEKGFEFTDYKDLPDEFKTSLLEAPGYAISITLAKNSGICIPSFIGALPLPEDVAIMKRVGKVFEQTYIRFLDLQKAEAQAREAQVEAALERVRAQTMAMHNSEDVGQCVVKMFSELTSLGVDEGTRFGIGILNHDNEKNQLWTARKDGAEVKMHIGHVEMSWHPLLKSARKAWKDQIPLHQYILEGEDLLNYYRMLNTAPDYKIQIPIKQLPKREIQYCFIFEHGFFYAFSPIEFQPEIIRITQRFSSLFEQTYRRYLDLVRAEAQATEAKIEAALEKVRSRSLAMHNSSELNVVVKVLFEKITELQVPSTAIGIQTFIEGSKDMQVFVCGDVGTGIVVNQYVLPYFDHPIVYDYLNAHKKKLESFVGTYSKKEKDSFYDVVLKLPELIDLAPEVKAMVLDSDFYEVTIVPAEKSLMAVNDFQGIPLSESQVNILKRFAKVFDQTYTRFLDLQKAEAQAREAQIEAALEKVRSRTLAMQRSEELSETAAVVLHEFKKFGNDDLIQATIGIYHEEQGMIEFRVTDWAGGGHQISEPFSLSMEEPTVLKPAVTAWRAMEKSIVVDLRGDELEGWINYRNKMTGVTINSGDTMGRRIITLSFFSKGHLSISSPLPLPEKTISTLERFAGVFDGTYTRFLDLQKAEAQAREAKIEAALERVRAQAMAMHHSDDLGKTIMNYYEQLDHLIDSTIVRCGAGLLNKINTIAEMSTASKKPDGETYNVKGSIDMKGHPILNRLYQYWLNQKEYNFVLQGNEIRDYYQYITGQVAIENKGEDELHFYFPMFTEGSFYVVTNSAVPESELKVFRRFSSVLSLTYKRFNDLQKAEAQTKEVIKQSSLDRIRGEIASMRTTNDLERITPLMWKELKILNIPFIRCGVFIMDEPQQLIHTFLSTPDGKAIAAFHLPYNSTGRQGEILTHWIDKKIYIAHWDDIAFSELGDLLVQQGALPSKEVYMKTVPKDGIYLHCTPFSQGMLYVGNTEKLKDDDVQLIQSVADAFATAYARYEDFNKLEAAKQQVDKTLEDLKQTQKQLIQSEKMASLGELTAGIAHEIQNPLNFVNNFSEVSNEMIKEILDARHKTQDQRAISEEDEMLNDIAQNLEKINHHGKRAGEIVKGMLQHSRVGSGKKEPTDINALCDEYLRLAYHGLRAKDKSFNAKFETDFDASLEKINVIPQDIGRVVLNLITNAFYVVNEKANNKQLATSLPTGQAGNESYQPTVSVSTKKDGGTILISIKDNGNGIPEHIKEKIFQPFFTTKPTGQGTGLGLSLSYDIVKAHGGELKAETVTNQGSLFIIHLPNDKSEC